MAYNFFFRFKAIKRKSSTKNLKNQIKAIELIKCMAKLRNNQKIHKKNIHIQERPTARQSNQFQIKVYICETMPPAAAAACHSKLTNNQKQQSNQISETANRGEGGRKNFV